MSIMIKDTYSAEAVKFLLNMANDENLPAFIQQLTAIREENNLLCATPATSERERYILIGMSGFTTNLQNLLAEFTNKTYGELLREEVVRTLTQRYKEEDHERSTRELDGLEEGDSGS